MRISVGDATEPAGAAPVLELLGLGAAVARQAADVTALRDGAFVDASTLVAGLLPDAPFGTRQRLGQRLVDGRPAPWGDLGGDTALLEPAVLSEPTFAASYRILRARGGTAPVTWFAMAPTKPGGDERKAWFLVGLPGNLVALELVSGGAHATYCFRVETRARRLTAGAGDPGQIARAVRDVSEALIDARFLREPMAIPDAQLAADPKYLRYRLALRALPSLASARARFVARLVHSDPAAWASALDDLIRWHGAERDEAAEWPGRAAQERQVAAAGGDDSGSDDGAHDPPSEHHEQRSRRRRQIERLRIDADVQAPLSLLRPVHQPGRRRLPVLRTGRSVCAARCPSCRAPLDDPRWVACPKCGAALNAATPATQGAPAPAPAGRIAGRPTDPAARRSRAVGLSGRRSVLCRLWCAAAVGGALLSGVRHCRQLTDLRSAVAAEPRAGRQVVAALGALGLPTGVPQFEQNFSEPTGLPQFVQTVARAQMSPLNCVVVCHRLAHLADLDRRRVRLPSRWRAWARSSTHRPRSSFQHVSSTHMLSRGQRLKSGMISLAAFLSASSRAPRSVMSLARVGAFEALPKMPPIRLLAPPRRLAGGAQLRAAELAPVARLPQMSQRNSNW